MAVREDKTDDWMRHLGWQDHIYEQVLEMSCDRRIGPYPCCSVVQGDCLELVKSVPARSIDALVADPPYGIDLNTNYATAQRGCRRDWPRIVGDDKPFDPAPWLGFAKVVLFGANHFASRLPDSSCWFVWYKRMGRDVNDQADCELAWTNGDGCARVVHHVWNGFLRDSERGEERQHPTQKPVAVMEWVIGKVLAGGGRFSTRIAEAAPRWWRQRGAVVTSSASRFL